MNYERAANFFAVLAFISCMFVLFMFKRVEILQDELKAAQAQIEITEETCK